jgi:hypothetical protein
MEKWGEQFTEFFSELSKTTKRQPQSDNLDKSEPQIEDFFISTVDPVFEEMAIGFTKLGRQVTTRKAKLVGQLVEVVERITIEFNGEEEFCYEIGIETFVQTPRAKVRSSASKEERYWHTFAEDFREVTKELLVEAIITTYNYSLKIP